MKPSLALPGGDRFAINPKHISVMATLFDAFQMVKTIRPILGPQRNTIDVADAPLPQPLEAVDLELAGVAARSEDLAE